MAGRDHPAIPEQYRSIIRWMAQHLEVEYGRLPASWPKTLRLDIDGCGEVLFCHGTPRDDNECFTRLTPEDRPPADFRRAERITGRLRSYPHAVRPNDRQDSSC